MRAQAIDVYRHKGKIIRIRHSDTEDQFLWEDYKRHDKRYYKLNRKHPVLKLLLEGANSYKNEIEKALRFIEETIPIPLITLKENENEIPHGQPFEGTSHDLVQITMKAMYLNILKQVKKDEQAKAIILSIEPFNFYPQYIEYLNTNEDDS